MLGVPLGSQAKNAEFVQRKLFSRLDKTVDRLKDFEDSQSAFFLLSFFFYRPCSPFHADNSARRLGGGVCPF